MAVRQVTPVEKVVKCHVNSVDGTPAYEGGVAYEAGTLVTLDGVSYVSIVNIEETDADTPPDAPDRWSVSPDAFASSSGGGGGSGLETRVAALEGEMTVAQGDIDDLETAVADKVDKVSGKGLSENDYTDADKAIVDGVTAALADKVDKVAGKGLSENDYTDADAAIVAGVTAALSDKVDKVAGKGLSTNDYNDTDKGVVDTTVNKFLISGISEISVTADSSSTFGSMLVDLITAFNNFLDTLADDEYICVESMTGAYQGPILYKGFYSKSAHMTSSNYVLASFTDSWATQCIHHVRMSADLSTCHWLQSKFKATPEFATDMLNVLFVSTYTLGLRYIRYKKIVTT